MSFSVRERRLDDRWGVHRIIAMDRESQARHAYTHSIEELEHDVLDMGSRVESMIGAAVDALVKLDQSAAHEVLDADDDIDRLDLKIEGQCLMLLALQHPIGMDMRIVGTVMKMITDIERVGDLAVDIAKCGMKIEREMGATTFVDIPKIAGVAKTMFRTSIEAFVKRDIELVHRVGSLEDQVDSLYRDLREQIHDHMRHTPDDVVAASWLLLAIHHIERIADHAVNIAERVNFMVTGQFEQIADSNPEH